MWIRSAGSLPDSADEEKNSYYDIIHTFSWNPATKDVFIDISADSQYILKVNGVQATFGQYPDFPHYKVYDTICLSPFLIEGNNKISLLLYYIGEDSSTYYKGTPGITFEIYGEGQTISDCSKNTFIRRSLTYHSGECEKISPQLFYTCRYDASDEDYWNEPDYAMAADFKSPVIFGRQIRLYPRPVKKTSLEEPLPASVISQGVFMVSKQHTGTSAQTMQHSFLSFCESRTLCETAGTPLLPSTGGIMYHACFENSEDGIYLILDFEKEETGYLTLDIESPAHTRIDISYGEHLDDLRVRAFTGGRNFAAQYFSGGGREKWTDLIRRVACRYVQIHVFSDQFRLFYAGIRPTHYPLVRKPSLRLPDHLHQKIYDIAVRTLELCMHEHYEDCPWREQALYSMDSRNQMLCGYYCFDNNEFVKASIRLLSLGRRDDGLLELCSPGKVSVTIPSFSLTFILQLYEYLINSGDTQFAEEMFPTAEGILRVFLERLRTNGLVPAFAETGYWNFYEWSAGLDGGAIFREKESPESFDAPLNGFLAIALRAFSETCRLLNKPDQAGIYSDHYHSLVNSMDSLFWDPEKLAYASFLISEKRIHYAELTQSLFIFCGAACGNRKGHLLNLMSSGANDLVPITISHSIFKYESLMTAPDKYRDFVFNEIARIWGNMVYRGATTFWETENGARDFDNAGSLCHGWSAIPVYFYHKYYNSSLLLD